MWTSTQHRKGWDPISSPLDRVNFNSGASLQPQDLYSAEGLEVSLNLPVCEELPLGAEIHRGPTQLHPGWTCWSRANRFPQMTFLPHIYRWPQLEASGLYETPFSCVSCMNFMSKSVCTNRNVNLLSFKEHQLKVLLLNEVWKNWLLYQRMLLRKVARLPSVSLFVEGTSHECPSIPWCT